MAIPFVSAVAPAIDAVVGEDPDVGDVFTRLRLGPVLLRDKVADVHPVPNADRRVEHEWLGGRRDALMGLGQRVGSRDEVVEGEALAAGDRSLPGLARVQVGQRERVFAIVRRAVPAIEDTLVSGRQRPFGDHLERRLASPVRVDADVLPDVEIGQVRGLGVHVDVDGRLGTMRDRERLRQRFLAGVGRDVSKDVVAGRDDVLPELDAVRPECGDSGRVDLARVRVRRVEEDRAA